MHLKKVLNYTCIYILIIKTAKGNQFSMLYKKSILFRCTYFPKYGPYSGGACPFLGSEHYNPIIVINNGLFPEKWFATTIRISNVHFGVYLKFQLVISK